MVKRLLLKKCLLHQCLLLLFKPQLLHFFFRFPLRKRKNQALLLVCRENKNSVLLASFKSIFCQILVWFRVRREERKGEVSIDRSINQSEKIRKEEKKKKKKKKRKKEKMKL
jgi:hypothetical protein